MLPAGSAAAAAPFWLALAFCRSSIYLGKGRSGNGVSLAEPPQAATHPTNRVTTGQRFCGFTARRITQLGPQVRPFEETKSRYCRLSRQICWYIGAMIGRLVGKLVSDDIDGTILLDVQGVGYEVTVPLGAVGRARRLRSSSNAKSDLVLMIHTRVREDSFDLYGFASNDEREVFRLLITLPSVGPKLGLAVLSALPPIELAAAVQANDIKRLNKISGVGKKTAERLILELKEKLPKLGTLQDKPGLVRPAETQDEERLIGALTNMGYKQLEAEKAVAVLKPRVGQEPISDLLRAALAELSS